MTVEKVRLGNVANINPRITTKPCDETSVSFLRMADVDAESGTTTRGSQRHYREVPKGYTNFIKGDLLVAKITPCFENGKIAQAEIEHPLGFGSTEFHVIRPDESRVNSQFLLALIRHPGFRLAGERRMTGSAGQRRVPEAYLSDIRIPLPPLDTQHWIAGLLHHVDVIRSKRRKTIALLDDLAQSIFLDMFGDMLDSHKSWPNGRVSDLVSHFEPGKSLLADQDGELTRYRVLRVSAVTSGRFAYRESKPVSPGYEPPSSHMLRDGDLIFSRANTESLIGATALASAPPSNLLLSDKLWRFVWREPSLATPFFVHQLFKQSSIRREVVGRSSGTSGSMKNISQANVLSLQFQIPPQKLRAEFDRRVRVIEELRQGHLAHLAELDALFASVQDRAFRGEL